MGPQTARKRAGSPEVCVMLQPGTAYSRLAKMSNGKGLLWKRPALVALILGCTVSFLTARSLTLRLVVSGAVTWSFVPLLEVASLAIVWKWHRPTLPLPTTVDVFFTGHGPWSLWLIGSGALWAGLPQLVPSRVWLGSGVVVLVWSGQLTSTTVSGEPPCRAAMPRRSGIFYCSAHSPGFRES
jgi:hypothetical protein